MATLVSVKKSQSNKQQKQAANSKPKTTANANKGAIDLGFASISNKATNAAKQTANTVNDSAERTEEALRGAFANATSNAKQAQEKLANASKEVRNNLSQAAAKASQGANAALEIARANAAALSESYASASKALKKASEEISNAANQQYAQNVEAIKAAFSCKNINEFFELANNQARRNAQNVAQQATKVSEALANAAAQALEPINEQAAKTSKKLASLIS